MKCKRCNFENKDQAKFCIMCGNKMEEIPQKKEENKSLKKLAYVVCDNEIIDEELLNSTVNTNIGELIGYTCGKVMDKTCFKYDIYDLISVKDYISKVVKREDFLTVLLNLLNAIQGVQARGVKLNNIFLKTGQIFIDEKSLMVKMICVPISNRNLDKKLKDLLKEIILNTEFDYNENCKYIKDLLRYFDENENIDIQIFQGILEKYLEETEECVVPQSVEIEKPVELPKENNQMNNRIISEFYAEDSEEAEEVGATTLLDMDSDYDAEGTTLLCEEVYPYLIRLKTDERIEINKPIFKIGKDRYNADYYVADNSAVSRHHADIVNKDGEYYIIDVGSTNHTYINGKRIQNNSEFILEDQNIIRLGNEEFQIFFN